MEKLKPITIENNEQYLRQISKKVNIEDPELHNNLVVLQDYCMQNEVMAMAAVQLGIPKRIVYVKLHLNGQFHGIILLIQILQKCLHILSLLYHNI